MVIRVKRENIYGVDRIFPLDFQEALVNLTGKKTLSQLHIKGLKDLGFTFEVVIDKI